MHLINIYINAIDRASVRPYYDSGIFQVRVGNAGPFFYACIRYADDDGIDVGLIVGLTVGLGGTLVIVVVIIIAVKCWLNETQPRAAANNAQPLRREPIVRRW